MTKRFFSFCICLLAIAGLRAEKVYDAASYGVVPNTGADVAGLVEQMLTQVKAEAGGKAVTVRFAPGLYNFYPESAPGPRDCTYLFDKFIKLMEENHNA